MTRAEVVSMLDRILAKTVTESGTVSENVAGSLLVRAADVRLENMAIDGDLIIADAVGNGDVYISNVSVAGDIILRGCGENSFHLLGGFEVTGKIIVTKTTWGAIRVVNESGETIPVIFVNDGQAGVTITGNVGTVVVACDAPVTLKDATVDTVSVTGENAKVTVAEDSRVSRLDVNASADGAALNVAGTVKNLALNTETTVNNTGNISHITKAPGISAPGNSAGNIGGETGGGTVPGGNAGGGETPAPEEKIEVKTVSLQLLAPAFANIPDTADALDAGYGVTTVWQNADGSAPTYRWKADASEQDVFTADHVYQAIITVTSGVGYVFAEDVAVTVTDGKTQPTSYTPYSVDKDGDKLIVTMKYPATEQVDPIISVWLSGTTAVKRREAANLDVTVRHNYLMDPAGFVYQWYRCDADGENADAVPSATGAEYTVPAADTTAVGTLYYQCRVSAMGKTVASNVFSIEVQDDLDVSTVPVPVIDEIGMWYIHGDNDICAGNHIYTYLSDLVNHVDLEYCITETIEGTVYYKDGTTQATSEQYTHWVFQDYITSDGLYRVGYGHMDLFDIMGQEYIFIENGIEAVKYNSIEIVVSAQYNDKELVGKTAKMIYRPSEPVWTLYFAADYDFDRWPEEVRAHAPFGGRTLTIDSETGFASISSDISRYGPYYGILEIYSDDYGRRYLPLSDYEGEYEAPVWKYDIRDILEEISASTMVMANVRYFYTEERDGRIYQVYYGLRECEIEINGGNG